MMHVGLGRTHPLHIEYIHLGACLSFIQDVMNEALLSHPKLPLSRKIGLVKALGKIIWIQNDLFAKWHIREGVDEYAVNDDVVIEEEGWLHKKKVVVLSESESSGEDENGTKTPKNEEAKIGVRPLSGNGAAEKKEDGSSFKKETIETEVPAACPFSAMSGLERDLPKH